MDISRRVPLAVCLLAAVSYRVAQADDAVGQAVQKVPISDQRLILAPYVWKLSGEGDTTWAEATMPGAYVRGTFQSTSRVGLLIDATANVGCPPASMPVIEYSIDEGPFQVQALTRTDGLYELVLGKQLDKSGAHRVAVFFRAADLIQRRWTASTAHLRIAGFTLGQDAVVGPARRAKKLTIGYGDSITQEQAMKKSLGAKTLVYPTPTWIVGSYDKQGKSNGMTAAWGGICCSDPPCVAVSLRKATYTYGSLIERKAFTISVPSQSQVKLADYFGLNSGRDTDKFAATGLTAVRSELVDAPYVEEFPLVLECVIVQVFELGLHTQFVGKILDVKGDEEVLDESGNPDILKILPIIFSPGNRAYYGVGPSLGHAFAVGKEI